jgi:hypothetical protein
MFKFKKKSTASYHRGGNDSNVLVLSKKRIWVFILSLFLVVALGVTSWLLWASYKGVTTPTTGVQYYNESLNFSVMVPTGWQYGTPNDVRVKEESKALTGGILFDMRYYALTKELVPITMIQKSPTGNKDDFVKFMTLAFTGSDRNYLYLQDKVKLMDDFKAYMTELKHTDIVISSVEDVNSTKLHGIVLYAAGTLSGKRINYIQYFEPAGANILTATYGYTGKVMKKPLKDLEYVVGSILYLQGALDMGTKSDEDIAKDGLKVTKPSKAPSPTPTPDDGIKAIIKGDGTDVKK